MFPATASRNTQAISSPCSANSASTAARSLNGASRVSRTVFAGTPGLLGTPKVTAPEPAATRNASPWPW